MQTEDVAAVRGELDAFLRTFDPCMGRTRNRKNVRVYVDGLLSDLQRKSVGPIAVRADIPPRTLQEFLATSRWDHAGVRDRLQRRVANKHAHEFSLGEVARVVPLVGSDGARPLGAAHHLAGGLALARSVGGSTATPTGAAELGRPADTPKRSSRRARSRPSSTCGTVGPICTPRSRRRVAAHRPHAAPVPYRRYGRPTSTR